MPSQRDNKSLKDQEEMEDEPLISVIIPTYNRAYSITHAISSALQQSYNNTEVIVVDDASTDNTSTIIRNINDPRIRYYCLEKNSGPSIARNAGIDNAHGRFVAFLDSDDEWDRKKIELQLAALKQQNDPENAVCYTQANMVEDNRTYLLPTRGKERDEPVGDYIMCGSDGAISTSSIMLSSALAKANPFPTDHSIFEDWDVLLRLEKIGVEWIYLDQPLFTWHNESRKDRLSASNHVGSEWLERHKHYLSPKAYFSFSVQQIACPLIALREKKLYTFKLLTKAFLNKELATGRFIKLFIKLILPPAAIKNAKKLSTFHIRN